MESGWFAPLRYFWRACTRENSPRQIAAGIAMGMVVGLVPKGNLTAAVLGVLLAATKLNLGAGLLSAAIFSCLSPMGDPVFHGFGSRVLMHPQLHSRWEALHQQPVIPWFSWNNTVVLGSLLSGLGLVYPTYRIALGVALRAQPHVQRWRQRKLAAQDLPVSQSPVPVPVPVQPAAPERPAAALPESLPSIPAAVSMGTAAPMQAATAWHTTHSAPHTPLSPGTPTSAIGSLSPAAAATSPSVINASGPTAVVPTAVGPNPAVPSVATPAATQVGSLVTNPVGPPHPSDAAHLAAGPSSLNAGAATVSVPRPNTPQRPKAHVATVLPTTILPTTILPTTIHVSRHLDTPYWDASTPPPAAAPLPHDSLADTGNSRRKPEQEAA